MSDAPFGVAHIAINVCRSCYAPRASRTHWIKELDQDADEWLADESDDLLDNIAKAGSAKSLHKTIDDLTHTQRTVVTPYYTKEIFYKEITQLCDPPVNAVRGDHKKRVTRRGAPFGCGERSCKSVPFRSRACKVQDTLAGVYSLEQVERAHVATTEFSLPNAFGTYLSASGSLTHCSPFTR